MKPSRIFILIIFFVLIANLSLAQTRGLSRVTIKANGKNISLYKESHALLIGVSDYTHGWPDLEGIPAELREVEKSLVKHGFKVTKVINPNNRQLQTAFENFIDQYGYDDENRLLFFFSGHGYSRKNGKKGYLVPTDAPDPRKDKKGFLRKALSMSRILTWSREIESKHAMFLFDSCFSGTIFKTKALPKVPPHISSITAKSVRQFITAGSAGEEVPANSVFTPSVVKALRGEADLNRDGYVTGTELGMYLHQKVLGYNDRQTPQYGKIKDPELDEGDFVFKVGSGKIKPETLTAKINTTSSFQLEADKLKLARERFELEKKMWEERKKLEAERKKFEEQKKALNQKGNNFDESNDNIIFSEYFNNNKRKWVQTNNKNITTSVRGGNYYFSHKRDVNAWLSWTSKTKINQYKDFFIQTNIKKVSGVNNYGYGIAWGLKDANNNYYFQIRGNGYYTVYKVKNAKYKQIIKWKRNKSINKNNSTNKLGLKKVGNKIYFYINNNQVDSMKFQPFMGNKIGYRIDMRQAVEIQDLVVSKVLKEKKQIVFSDYFDNNKNNWAIRNDKKVEFKIKNGNYRFNHKTNRSRLVWKSVSLSSSDDYTIECDMKKESGIYNNGYGIVWGLKDASNCFFFQISGDGHYRYMKSVNSKYISIIKWKKSTHINKYNNAYNNLTVRKRGNTLKFYINNQYVDSAFAETFMGNKIGFRIDTKQSVSFRNLIVSKIVRR
ncbi:MAG: hypothetical protein GY714_19810 [Desulfobacterales bacterium]|nr:hypothetical protein [Desulfobacterales bacterium]MCP4163340.1 hypothetical protein [Deltaproteobacteria bacterium]